MYLGLDLGLSGSSKIQVFHQKTQKVHIFQDFGPGEPQIGAPNIFLKQKFYGCTFLIHIWGFIWGFVALDAILYAIFCYILLGDPKIQCKIPQIGAPNRSPKYYGCKI